MSDDALDIIAPVMERLDRLTRAVESLVALLKPSDLAAFNQEARRTSPEQRAAQGGPLDPEPPYPVPVLAPSAPVPPNIPLKAGDVHTVGHNPLRENNRGLYCPTKVNGDWCKWTAKAAR